MVAVIRDGKRPPRVSRSRWADAELPELGVIHSVAVPIEEVRMSGEALTTAAAVPPPVTLLQMMTGHWVTQAVYVAR